MALAINTIQENEIVAPVVRVEPEHATKNTLIAMQIVFALMQEMMMDGLKTDSKINESIGKGQESIGKLVTLISAQIKEVQDEYNEKAAKASIWGKIGMVLGVVSLVLGFVPGGQGFSGALKVAAMAAGAVSAAAGVTSAVTQIVSGAYELQAASRGKDLGEKQADMTLVSGYQQTAQGVSHRMSEWEDEGTKTLSTIRGSVTEGILGVGHGQEKAAQLIRSGFNRL